MESRTNQERTINAGGRTKGREDAVTKSGAISLTTDEKSEFRTVGLAHNLLRKLRRGAPNASLCVGQAGLYQASLARAILREIRSLVLRIREIRRTQLHRRGILLDPLRHRASLEVRERASACCSEDMRNLYASRPLTTLIEAELFVRGWEAGAEWSTRSCGTERHA